MAPPPGIFRAVHGLGGIRGRTALGLLGPARLGTFNKSPPEQRAKDSKVSRALLDVVITESAALRESSPPWDGWRPAS